MVVYWQDERYETKLPRRIKAKEGKLEQKEERESRRWRPACCAAAADGPAVVLRRGERKGRESVMVRVSRVR